MMWHENRLGVPHHTRPPGTSLGLPWPPKQAPHIPFGWGGRAGLAAPIVVVNRRSSIIKKHISKMAIEQYEKHSHTLFEGAPGPRRKNQTLSTSIFMGDVALLQPHVLSFGGVTRVVLGVQVVISRGQEAIGRREGGRWQC
jgi:hypothetical protein